MSEFKIILCFIIASLLIIKFLASWQIKRSAKKSLEQQKVIYSGKMEYADASPRDFPWLDESFYSEVSQKMSEVGFRHIGDFECLTLSKQFPSMRTFIRRFIGDMGTTVGEAYHVKILGLMRIFVLLKIIPRNIRTIEFLSEFTDYTFLTTSNNAGFNLFSDFPGIISNQLAPSTPFDKLLSTHLEKLERVVKENNVKPVCFGNREDVLASGDRMQMLKSAHKKRTGYISREHFEQIAGDKSSVLQNEYMREFEKARDQNNID
jgi:hypothetical protein